jgi:hypothetical protein
LTNCNKGTSGTGTLAWTNVTTAGVAAGPSCNGWTSIASGFMGTVGKIDSLGADWTNSGAVPCNTPASHFCFQVLR